jgi:hypothetical protein
MKFVVVIIGCALYCAQSLKISSYDNHEGIFGESWDKFWGSFGKGGSQ